MKQAMASDTQAQTLDAPQTLGERVVATVQRGREWLSDRADGNIAEQFLAVGVWVILIPLIIAVALTVLPVWLMRRGKPLGAFGALVLLITVVVALFAPLIVGLLPAEFPAGKAEYVHSFLRDTLHAPSGTYLLGTDPTGRDMLTRLIYGAEITVLVGFGTIILTALVSTTIGVVSGYFGGKTDLIIQRIIDTWIAFPPIFLLVTIVAVFGSGGDGFLGLGRGPDFGPQAEAGDRWLWEAFPRTTVIILSLSLILAGSASRVVRGAVLGVKSQQYVEAARAMGAGDIRIMRSHILPNIMPVVIVLASIYLGVAVLAEATISFLGLGIPPPFPTWGQMLSGLARIVGPSSWWVAVFPGAAIFLAVYGFNMMGDALRDILDPRLRQSG